MTIIVGENSYVTLAEAEEYFTNRFGTSQYAAFTDNSVKENLLRMATILLDSYCDWNGSVTSLNQELQFPRNGSSDIPSAIKKAQCEIAEAIATQGDGTTEESATLRKMTVDVISFEWNDNNKTNSPYYNKLVKSYLNPYCLGKAYGNSVIRV